MEVGEIVATLTFDEEIISAALLHDTIEDCQGITLEVLAQEFSERVAASYTRMPVLSDAVSPGRRFCAGMSVCKWISFVTSAQRTGSKGSMPKGLSFTGTPSM